jgi:protein-arginine kinase activator protein McsA
MVCDICGIKNPEINIQQVIGNKKRNIHICRKCANDQGIIKNNDTLEFSLSKLVNFYLEIDKKKNNLICESCGTSL